MNMRIALWMVLFLFAGRSSAGDLSTMAVDLTAIEARIEQGAVLRGAFEQEKRLSGFAQPLRSSGRFLVAQGHGVLWDTEQPFASTLVVAADRIRVQTEATRQELGAGSEAFARINALLMAVLAGRLGDLEAAFEIEGGIEDGSAWTLHLRPRDAAMERVLALVDLAGGAHVEWVRLQDAEGNLTEIRFSAHRIDTSPLSDAEAARFE